MLMTTFNTFLEYTKYTFVLTLRIFALFQFEPHQMYVALRLLILN